MSHGIITTFSILQQFKLIKFTINDALGTIKSGNSFIKITSNITMDEVYFLLGNYLVALRWKVH